MRPFERAWILIKARKPMSERPHQARVLAPGAAKHMKLQSWANRSAAEQMRAAGKAASGPEWEAMRNELMRQAVMNPEQFGLGFLDTADDGMPHLFPGQMREAAVPEPAPAPVPRVNVPEMPPVPPSVTPTPKKDDSKQMSLDEF